MICAIEIRFQRCYKPGLPPPPRGCGVCICWSDFCGQKAFRDPRCYLPGQSIGYSQSARRASRAVVFRRLSLCKLRGYIMAGARGDCPLSNPRLAAAAVIRMGWQGGGGSCCAWQWSCKRAWRIMVARPCQIILAQDRVKASLSPKPWPGKVDPQ